MNTISYIIIALAELVVIDITATRIFQCARKMNLYRFGLYGIYLVLAALQPLLFYDANLNTVIALFISFFVSYSYAANLFTHVLISLTAVAIGICSEGGCGY